MLKILATICVLGMAATSCTVKRTVRPENTDESDHELTMLVGTYTSGDSKGIYSFRFDEATGTATALSETDIENPSYLVPSADGRFVYAVSELNDERAAAVAFAFDKEKGTFRLLNSQRTGGKDPCYIITNGNQVVTANYSGGSISVFPVAKDGSLLPTSSLLKFQGSGTDKERQDMPHLHCVRITLDGNYLFADDLGTDRIYKYRIQPDAKADHQAIFLKEGTPAFYQVKAGSGPRHLTFSSDGRYAYLLTELSGMIHVFDYADGVLNEIQSVVADTVGAKGSADIHISPDGKFLYASNRLKADGIAIFRINPENGMLTKAGYQLTGIHPRNFIITPNGKYLLAACRDSNAIQVYERDADTGLLTDTHQDIKVDKPVCVKFVP